MLAECRVHPEVGARSAWTEMRTDSEYIAVVA